jgi:cysteine-rich repeat protein
MLKVRVIPCSLVLVALVASCADNRSEGASTGLQLRSFGDGIDGFDITVTQVACPGSPLPDEAFPAIPSAHVPLSGTQTLPGNLEAFKDKPFVVGSEHGFADHFFSLDAGCYDVTATPYGPGAKNCSSATLAGVEVQSGLTTEKMLVSQCLGVDLGALDVVAALNHDPSLDRVYFPNSKFSCAEPTEICVEVSDPDSDPLAVEVTFAADVPCSATAFADTVNGLCSTITCTAPGTYAPTVTVYDLAYTMVGDLVRIEDLLADFGTVGYDSHASLEAVVHVDGFSGFIDGDGDGFGDEPYFGCIKPDNGVDVGGDCNDGDPAINPGAQEICNDGIDNNCDGLPLAAPARRFAPGSALVTFDAAVTAGIPPCAGGVGTGIAFDGTSLILSCWGSNVLERVDAAGHGNNGSVTVTGLPAGDDLQALAWDGGRNRLWACNGHSNVVLIDTGTGTVDASQPMLTGIPCTDGLAYDASDDTLWASGDVETFIHHYDTSGAEIVVSPLSGLLGACGNSGIAVGGPDLYLANNGCSEIYVAPKDLSSSMLFANFAPYRLEDLECDGITFAPTSGAIWSLDAYDRILNAWEIEPGKCESGGGLPSCGDGDLDPGEECDDGNLVNGDGCTSNCRIEGCGL